MVIYRLAVYIKWRVECRTAGCKGSWDFISSQIRVLLFTGLIMSTRETRICALSQPTPPRRHPQLSFAPWMSDMIITNGRVATGSHINRHSAFSAVPHKHLQRSGPPKWEIAEATTRLSIWLQRRVQIFPWVNLALPQIAFSKTLTSYLAPRRMDVRGGEVVQEEKPRGPLSSHALRTSCNCTRDGSTRTQRGYSNLWK